MDKKKIKSVVVNDNDDDRQTSQHRLDEILSFHSDRMKMIGGCDENSLTRKWMKKKFFSQK